MKVLKPGRIIEPPTYRVNCPHCEAKLEYTDDDIEWPPAFAYRIAPGVVATVTCGHCEQRIAHRPRVAGTKQAETSFRRPSP